MRYFLALYLLAVFSISHAEVALVAVAANFAAPAQEIATAFESQSQHRITISTGATGKFYTQIKQGAPYDVLLSADDTTINKLLSEQQAIQVTQFTYAIGRLVLWSATAGYVDSQGGILMHGDFKHFAIANPLLAPYGKAAIEVLKNLGLDDLKSQFVTGENIAQTYQFVSTGNAELGFVARSQVEKNGKLLSGSAWLVPQRLHAPILQEAVLLKKGEHNEAARSFLAFLKSPKAKRIIQSYGYEI